MAVGKVRYIESEYQGNTRPRDLPVAWVTIIPNADVGQPEHDLTSHTALGVHIAQSEVEFRGEVDVMVGYFERILGVLKRAQSVAPSLAQSGTGGSAITVQLSEAEAMWPASDQPKDTSEQRNESTQSAG